MALRTPPVATTVRWTVTVVATIVSTIALDVVVTAGGVLLAASPLIDDAPRGAIIGVLVATYVLWGAGLRVSVMANWRLLEETGTSTNALSKVLFDLARLRSSSERVARAASAAGYLVPEVAKEVPYYVGAFGAAVLSDVVSSTDALVFLAGTNIAGAVCEYGVAWLTNTYLAGRSRRAIHASTS